MKMHEPPMTFVDDQTAKEWLVGLENNKDGYGRGIYTYASEWATRMEKALKKAKPTDIKK